MRLGIGGRGISFSLESSFDGCPQRPINSSASFVAVTAGADSTADLFGCSFVRVGVYAMKRNAQTIKNDEQPIT
jgi:hypothetical protein